VGSVGYVFDVTGWDQFLAHSARVEAIQYAAAQPAENRNQGK